MGHRNLISYMIDMCVNILSWNGGCRLVYDAVVVKVESFVEWCDEEVVKLSWNVIYVDLISAAFPDAAALYLYHNPVEVIANVLQETTAALCARGDLLVGELTGLLPQDTAQMGNVEYQFSAPMYRRFVPLPSCGALVLPRHRQLCRHRCRPGSWWNRHKSPAHRVLRASVPGIPYTMLPISEA